MNNWWYKSYDWIIRKLVKEPWKHISYFLSHGFFHSIMCVVVGVFTAIWGVYNCSSSDTSMHNISLALRQPYSPSSNNDSLHTLLIEFEIDSDTILKHTNNKYKSRISITYGYDYTCRDSQYVDTPKEPTIIRLFSEPFLDDLYIEHDSSFVTFEIPEIKETESYNEFTHSTYKFLPDSIVEINVKPFKNIINETGGENGVGSQTIYIYSNNFGLSDDDSYYNYAVDLSSIPKVKELTNFIGFKLDFQFGDVSANKGIFHIGNKRLLYQYIYPQPDILNNGFLYYSEEAISKVKDNKGIIIQATDIDAQNKNNKKSIIYSVLVGTGLALFFDICIQLVREWSNMNRRKDEEERKEKELKEKLKEGVEPN